MAPLHFDLSFKPVDKQKLTRNMLFFDDWILAGFSGSGKDEKIARSLKLSKGNALQDYKPKWDTLFTGNFNNPCKKKSRIFFESYSGLWHKKPPAVNYFNLDSLTNENNSTFSGIIPELFAKGTILKVFGLPDTMIAIKVQDKFITPASSFPVQIVSTDDPLKVHMDFSSKTNNLRPQANDFISPDLTYICRFEQYYHGPAKSAAVVKYCMETKKVIDHIAMTEFVKTHDGLSFGYRFHYGYSVQQSVMRLFFLQDNSLSIINLNSFEKTSLLIPYCPDEASGANLELDFHPNKPWIYFTANDGTCRFFNYLLHRFEDVSCPGFDKNYGLLFSCDGKWMVYVNKDDGKLVIEYLKDL